MILNKIKPKIFIFELNEISPLILNKYIKRYPNSSISKFAKKSQKLITIADDIKEKDLYPAQSWASINSGKPFKRHKVKWYNDTKKNCSQIWDDLSINNSIGIVNVLHSSNYKNFRFFNYFISDPYKKFEKTIPSSLLGFKKFINSQTFKSNRISKFQITFKEIKYIFSFFLKIRLRTYLRILKILFEIKFKKKKERLRNVDFLLHFDIFLWSVKNKSSDINVFFTNHIASQIHRYLGALLPSKNIKSYFGNNWIRKNSDEVFYSMRLFDKNFYELENDLIKKNDVVVFVSSMGQGLVNKYNKNHLTKYVHNQKDFFDIFFDNKEKYEVLGSMSPQLTIKSKDNFNAKTLLKELKKKDNSKIIENYDLNNNILTISVNFKNYKYVYIDNKKYSLSKIGVKEDYIDTQNTGKHIKEGILLIKSPKKIKSSKKISYLKYRSIIERIVTEYKN